MARFEADSFQLMQHAAEGGVPDALFELGLAYCAGRDVELDLIEAHKWFNLAALRGNAEARRYRQELAEQMPKADIGAAQRRAREWISRH